MAREGARIRLPRIGIGTTLMAGVAVLGLIVLASGVIALLSFFEIRRSFDRVASGQSASIVAARLGQTSEALAGLAPTLYAAADPAASRQIAQQVSGERQRLGELTSELGTYLDPGEALTTIRSTSAELSETIDRLSTAMSAKAAAEASRTLALAAVGAVLDDATTLSGQPRGAPIARWFDAVRGAMPDVFTVLSAVDAAGIDGPAAKVGVVISYAAEIAATAGDISAGSRAAAPALPGLHARLTDALTGESGLFAAQRRIVDLDGQLRQLLARNEAAAQRMNGAVDTVMDTVRADIGGQNAGQSAVIAAGMWWLAALTLTGVLIAVGTLAHVRKQVALRRQAVHGGILNRPVATGATGLVDGRDRGADTVGPLPQVVAGTDSRDGTVQPGSPIAASSSQPGGPAQANA